MPSLENSLKHTIRIYGLRFIHKKNLAPKCSHPAATNDRQGLQSISRILTKWEKEGLIRQWNASKQRKIFEVINI